MSLKKYQEKRDFTKTKEPSSKIARAKPSIQKTKTDHKLIYVIHKHAARHLHYDLRLEMNGVLKSWAVPKGPSLDPHIKRLAIEVEDHPLEYAHFKGIIPVGQYGAGKVEIWDHGTWEGEKNFRSGYKKGHISFILKGKKLRGTWNLIRLHLKDNDKNNNWLLFKAQDKLIKNEKE